LITATILPWILGAFALCLLLNAWRLFIGPAIADRVLALDTLYINTLALLVLLGMYWNTVLYFEAALVIALVGFAGTVIVSKFVLRGDVVE
jgi:multicomponent K+:H+ antiporter subunit F